MNRNKTRLLLLMLILCGLAPLVHAQRGIGFRFGSDFNWFFRSENYTLIDGSWSNIVIGPYYQAYFKNGGAQVGLNFRAKSNTDRGFPNLPVVQQDINGDHNVGLTAIELDMKAGPRFGPVNPKIGYLVGYRFKREGMLEPGSTMEVNAMYVALPFGCSIEFPTGYGSVSAGAFYEVGLTNALKNPDPGTVGWNGSKVRTLNFELTILFMSGEQKPKNLPPEAPEPDW